MAWGFSKLIMGAKEQCGRGLLVVTARDDDDLPQVDQSECNIVIA